MGSLGGAVLKNTGNSWSYVIVWLEAGQYAGMP